MCGRHATVAVMKFVEKFDATRVAGRLQLRCREAPVALIGSWCDGCGPVGERFDATCAAMRLQSKLLYLFSVAGNAA